MGTEGAVRWNLGAGSGDTVGALLALPCQDRATRGSAAHPVGQRMKSLGWASASPSHASVHRVLVAAPMLCSGRAHQRPPDTLSFTAAICARKGHTSPS